MAILSIQSQVLNGAVGNSAAGFILSRLGFEVWPLPTVLLSHHPGHGHTEGGPVKPQRLAALLRGLSSRRAFSRCDAVISGYLGAAAAVPIVADAVREARAANPSAIYLCDPVMGEAGRAYVAPDQIAAIRDILIPMADVIFPNAFEISLLTDTAPDSRAAAFAALESLGRPLAILTGFAGRDTEVNSIDILLTERGRRKIVTVPDLRWPKGESKHDRPNGANFSGAGDAFAALFLAAWLPGRNSDAALSYAASATAALLTAHLRFGTDDFPVAQSQSDWVQPVHFFAVSTV